MPSSSGEQNRRLNKGFNNGAPPPEQEQLLCPRCDSNNTKFCYYNNYNFSQPRYFCKSCRRYWTHGGTLRDIPVGGGTRRHAKRSRSSTTTTISATNGASSYNNNYPLPATPVLLPMSGNQGNFGIGGGESKGNLFGSFTSLLNTQGPGFIGLGGFGVAVEDVGFGVGRGMWGFAGAGDGGVGGGRGNALQFEGGDGGGDGGVGGGRGNALQFDGGGCFSWPDLAISTPGNGVN